MRRDVHFHVVIAQLFRCKRRTDPAKDGANAGDELARAERLGDIVVCARLQAANPVALLAARGEHDDRNVGRFRTAAKPAADLETKDALDHPVEDDDVGRIFAGEKQGLFTIAGPADLIILALEMPDEELGERSVVLDKQELLARHAGFRRRFLVGSTICSPVAA